MGSTATATQLPGVLHTLEPTLNRFGYLAVAGLVFAEDFGAPVPGETVLIVGAIYAGAGRLNILLVALLGFCGAVLGDNLGFAIGRVGGRQLLERYGRYIFLTTQRIDRAAAYFEDHGARLISVARFIWGLRQANGLIAGTIGMSWKRFLLFNVIGAAMWVTVWTAVGYLSGSHIDSVYYAATNGAKYLALAVAVSVLGYLGHRLIRRRRMTGCDTTCEPHSAADPTPRDGAAPPAHGTHGDTDMRAAR